MNGQHVFSAGRLPQAKLSKGGNLILPGWWAVQVREGFLEG